MNRTRGFRALSVSILSMCPLFMVVAAANASDHRRALTEEFHKPYALAPDGRVELENINGAVHISTWDQNQVKVDAVKYADSKDRLADAHIEIDSSNGHLSIRTKYPARSLGNERQSGQR